MSGRGFIALVSGLLGVVLLLGVLVSRSRAPQPVPSLPVPSAGPAPSRASSPFVGRQLTPNAAQRLPARWPVAAEPVQQPTPPPPALGVGTLPAATLPVRPPPPATTQSAPDGGTFDARALDAAPPLPEAGVIPIDAGVAFPDASEQPQPEPLQTGGPDGAASPRESDPRLVRQGRVFNGGDVTSSSWDEEDVSEHSVVPDRVVVPDREVTRSSFDR